ncbi:MULTISPECIES: RICIN domain-containing protein [unclassified Streptomyces]|uniref:RICIN domain-containing protein n=1 Tax=unclassified Streptomyces TaxID=2593676 RepID=UPI0016553A7D|nr:RICIN domain-containing protein [Streptomyces sp. CB02980]MCB8900989.1 RICIN domain-containing protein [Streptomyces sp. CB02980]
MRSHSFHRGTLALLTAAGLLGVGATAVSAQPVTQPAAHTETAATVPVLQGELQTTGATAGALRAADVVQTFANMATGSCLDDSQQYGLRGYACNGGVYQKWNVHVWGDGTRQLRNLATNECLFDDGFTLDTRGCNSSREQSWFAHKSGDRVTFQSQATGECLDDSQYGLRTIQCYYNRNQTWR